MAVVQSGPADLYGEHFLERAWNSLKSNSIGDSTMKAQQESTTLTPCPKCHSGMTQVTITPHPVAPRMLRHTYVCRACNQTRTYMLPTPPVAEEIYAGTSSRRVDVMVA